MKEKQETIKQKTQIISEKNVIEYTIAQFENVKKSNKIKNLVSFQTKNKYMIMAHDQNELKIMGNIVASNKKNSLSKILSDYELHLKNSLQSKPTIKKHSNVLLHIFGYFSKNFNTLEKEYYFDLLKQFQKKEITLGHFLVKISPMVYKFNNTYLANQTYFLLYSDLDSFNLFQMLQKE